ncbi:hypothetical protein [Agrococcus terreus]|uniref:DUF2637 domain-containing protein n=1 Tax=Agrococcus terreus TaxID=574649 RepID=A0ABQ2KR64_9MICO|nr:hypothetical protein [Agrococcus terreus]GGN89932.1 hypothetical protein GCM10010968_27080 [Agrococcus terreus]
MTRMSAVERARTIAPGQAVRWKQLELDAFREHPAVLRGIDPSIRVRGGRGAPGRMTAVLLWAGFAAVVAPVVAMAILVPSRISAAAPVDYEAAIPVSSLLFLFADAALVPLAVAVLRQRAGQRFFRGLGIYSVVMAVLTVVISVGVSPSVDGVWLWMIPVLVGAAAGLALAIAPTPSAGGGDDARPDGPRSGPRAVARAAIAELDASEQQRVGAELRAAIDELARSGAISARDADWAKGAQLGMLSIRMSQPRR